MRFFKSFVFQIRGWYSILKMALQFPGGWGRKCRFFRYAKLARNNGVISFRIKRVATDFVNAWYAMSNMSNAEKNWYFKHGFNPSKKFFYGVLPINYNMYISDFEFYNTHNYKNRSSHYLFDNKLNTFYLLYPFKKWFPKHYFFVEDEQILPLDFEEKHNYSPQIIFSLLRKKSILAAKKCHGGHGEGFYKLEYKDGSIWVNGKRISDNNFWELIHSMRGYIITDFIKPAGWIRQMAGENSFAVLRVMTIYDREDGPQFERVMIRIGTEKSGPTQAGHDHMYVGIDKYGKLYNCIYEYSDYSWEKMDKHPETGEKINGRVLPNMEMLKHMCITISGYLPNSPYLIFDIIPTDDSFSILEINSHGQPFIFEPFDPVKNSNYFKRLFEVKQ